MEAQRYVVGTHIQSYVSTLYDHIYICACLWVYDYSHLYICTVVCTWSIGCRYTRVYASIGPRPSCGSRDTVEICGHTHVSIWKLSLHGQPWNKRVKMNGGKMDGVVARGLVLPHWENFFLCEHGIPRECSKSHLILRHSHVHLCPCVVNQSRACKQPPGMSVGYPECKQPWEANVTDWAIHFLTCNYRALQQIMDSFIWSSEKSRVSTLKTVIQGFCPPSLPQRDSSSPYKLLLCLLQRYWETNSYEVCGNGTVPRLLLSFLVSTCSLERHGWVSQIFTTTHGIPAPLLPRSTFSVYSNDFFFSCVVAVKLCLQGLARTVP